MTAGLVVVAVAVMGLPVWVKVGVGIPVVLLAVVTVNDRLASEWVALTMKNRRDGRLPQVSAAELGSVALPGEDVAVRWEGEDLVALIALHPQPFTPTIVVAGKALHDDVVDSAVVEDLLACWGPEFTADIVSAGWRVARSAPLAVYGQCEQQLGADPCPGFRRSWVVVRVCPARLPVSVTGWRGGGVVGAANALVAAATRVAEGLSKQGVDARLARSFARFDELAGVEVVSRQWSTLRGSSSYTTVYSAPGGPDQWWSVRADRTVTRLRVAPGCVPRSVVALTTVRRMDRDPKGWIRLRGNQLEALSGSTPVADRHHRVPVGSAGILVGRAPADQSPVYVAFDAGECGLSCGDSGMFVQLVVRAAAAGAAVCLPPGFEAVAAGVGTTVDTRACIVWPGAGVRTWLVTARAPQIIAVSPAMVVLPRGRIPIEAVHGREDAVLGVRAAGAASRFAATGGAVQQQSKQVSAGKELG
ncbi:type VII secretion protein EccE [Mycobacterium talmoniae]|uniref:Type VII secretion protein EccE n=2 Tax=Mycobacterium talmoniae TaxID=1858794 RepID=A0A1S1NI28_9MYCO|nr:type VII secretion protein EccE [Mycobacterium talmoniae]